MNEKALKVINAIIPGSLIQETAKTTGSKKKDIVNIAIELTNKLTNTDDISKEFLEKTIKSLVNNKELMGFLNILEEKYSISKEVSSNVLTTMLPVVYKNIIQTDQSLFEEDIKEDIKEEIVEEETNIEPVPVEDVLKNIENKAKEEEKPQEEPVKKKKFQLFKKKEEKVVEKEEKTEEIQEELPVQSNNLLNKICSIVVLLAFLALLTIIIVLVLKQKGA